MSTQENDNDKIQRYAKEIRDALHDDGDPAAKTLALCDLLQGKIMVTDAELMELVSRSMQLLAEITRLKFQEIQTAKDLKATIDNMDRKLKEHNSKKGLS